MSDKTEEATPNRLRKAREDGDVPTSAFASQAIAFLCAVAVAKAALDALASRASSDLRAAIARAGDPSPIVAFDSRALATSVVTLTAPLLAAAAVAVVITSVVQSGGIFATKRVKPTLKRLDLVAGLAALVSASRLFSVLRAALFGATVGTFAFGALADHAGDFARTAGRWPEAAALASLLALTVAKRTAVFGVVLALVDVVVMRRVWAKRLRMSKAEVKREIKEAGGDPLLKAARERAYEDMLSATNLANVRKATVVVADHRHVACAIRYEDDGNETAPVVLASGRGGLAADVLAAAQAYDVPVVRDAALARALLEIDVGGAIPESLYEVVAATLRQAWAEKEGDRGSTVG